MMAPDWDVLVVGRSYAGLSAALNLGRARRSVLVVGSGGPRNGSVHHVHGLITQDGASPADVVATAEKELEKYPTVELVDDRVTGLVAIEGGFRVSIGKRTSTVGRVILATGSNDNPPAIAGLAEHWGRGVFTCPYCDGFEHADTHLAIVGATELVPHMAQVLKGWSGSITVFDGALDEAVRADLVAHGVAVEERPVTRVIGDGDAVSALVLADGTQVAVGALFVVGLPVPNSRLAVALGCTVDEHGFVQVDAMAATSVPGVLAVGDVTSPFSNMSMAITAGVIAALACNRALLERDWEQAVQPA
jgi:thioredoxin reductase